MLCASAGAVAGDSSKELYTLYCSSCHAVKNAEAPEAFNAPIWKKRMSKGTDAVLTNVIKGVGNILEFEEWLEPIARAAGRWPLKYVGQSLIIPTLEGDHEARPGDWIIMGIKGEIYPCKPDIFEQTYEAVT